ncbi:nucleotidyltransferase family protein [Salinimonas lutimaris]|uniref:nucleotidyltransferase family protein n=1 Tax=Salinimonas lutimaris TaxID=914153 RepID=UPI0010C0EB5E|nr:nucleotidyltransferase family protein [Salinimonas lutimaris]
MTARLIANSDFHMQCLYAADKLGLHDWMIGTGFVRNLIWDHTHGKASATSLNDIDLIYFDRQHADKPHDMMLEKQLNHGAANPVWEVRNQARMHLKKGHQPYQNSTQAISYWVETATCVGVRLEQGMIKIIAPLGLANNWAGIVRRNPAFSDSAVFLQRVAQKQWLSTWPQLRLDKE